MGFCRTQPPVVPRRIRDLPGDHVHALPRQDLLGLQRGAAAQPELHQGGEVVTNPVALKG